MEEIFHILIFPRNCNLQIYMGFSLLCYVSFVQVKYIYVLLIFEKKNILFWHGCSLVAVLFYSSMYPFLHIQSMLKAFLHICQIRWFFKIHSTTSYLFWKMIKYGQKMKESLQIVLSLFLHGTTDRRNLGFGYRNIHKILLKCRPPMYHYVRYF